MPAKAFLFSIRSLVSSTSILILTGTWKKHLQIIIAYRFVLLSLSVSFCPLLFPLTILKLWGFGATKKTLLRGRKVSNFKRTMSILESIASIFPNLEHQCYCYLILILVTVILKLYANFRTSIARCVPMGKKQASDFRPENTLNRSRLPERQGCYSKREMATVNKGEKRKE